jgi:DNA polymerase-3 subunit gamma/tau
MSDRYIALYRKWRPSVFEDVVEQEHVVRTLRYSVDTGRIAHAYLFCGTRGTGKTTMAHILSRAINCLSPKNGDPCNECEICREILSGSSTDVLEIDAASNNSVDNVREIREEVVYAPSHAKYKVYIIDEVHMLSTGAFNALLKTLEEPPAHVVFILATTEPHKLPATILSRCQRFDFRRITMNSIICRLDEIASADGIKLDNEAARLISRLSDGALRDAISLLDQCLSQGRKEISHADVLSVVGIVNDTFTSEIAGDVLCKDIKSLLEKVNTLVMDGKDIPHFLSDLVQYFRNLLICKVSGTPADVIDVHTEMLDCMISQAATATTEELIDIIRELSSVESMLKWAPNPRVMLEVSLVKLCSEWSGMTSSSTGAAIGASDPNMTKRIEALEIKLAALSSNPAAAVSSNANVVSANTTVMSASASLVSSPASTSPGVPQTAESENRPAPSDKPAKLSPGGSIQAPEGVVYFEQWKNILGHLKSLGRMSLYTFLSGTRAVELEGGILGIIIDANTNKLLKTVMAKHENLSTVEEAIKKVTGKELQLRLVDHEISANELKKASPKSGDPLEEKARSLAQKAGIPFDIVDE